MQVSKKQLNKTIEKQIFSILNQLVIDIRNQEEATDILTDLLTETERLVLAKRLAIALFLDKGRSYENIRDTLKVSSATIASVQDQMGNPGLQAALRKIKSEDAGDEWPGKLGSIVGKIFSK